MQAGTSSQLASLARYREHIEQTAQWCLRSVQHGAGGSSAHFSLYQGWSRPYPETTGYLIPTLLRLERFLERPEHARTAEQLGQWLLSIQNADGSWNGGLHPGRDPKPSVFNTGQILKGMAALFEHTQAERYLEAGVRGALWLASRIGDDGLWPASDYRAAETPSYYTHVAWPMLEIWKLSQRDLIRERAERFLRVIAQRRRPNGVIAGWGFEEGKPAFTHTIAYTIRGFQESARLTGDHESYEGAVRPALERLYRKAELAGGRLPGHLDDSWKSDARYVCLTGNAQVAICLLLLEQRQPDLRLVNAAAKLCDFVCESQRLQFPLGGIRGAVAGSRPVWGRYMTARYPNWAAKYHCDALMQLHQRLVAAASTA